MLQLFQKAPVNPPQIKMSERYPAKQVDLKNIHFKSKMEANVYLWLDYLIRKDPHTFFTVWYEPERFHFKKSPWSCTSYVPDFKLTTKKGSYYFEVKGFWDVLDRAKINLMKRDYPWIRLKIVDKRQYNKVKDYYGHRIPEWL